MLVSLSTALFKSCVLIEALKVVGSVFLSRLLSNFSQSRLVKMARSSWRWMLSTLFPHSESVFVIGRNIATPRMLSSNVSRECLSQRLVRSSVWAISMPLTSIGKACKQLVPNVKKLLTLVFCKVSTNLSMSQRVQITCSISCSLRMPRCSRTLKLKITLPITSRFASI